jgi:membrane protein implicated in regulation of membrane protease activity
VPAAEFNPAIIVWLIILVVAAVVEISTVQLISIWFSFGALVALITASVGASTRAQLAFFLVAAFVLLIFTRPLAKKLLIKAPKRTNADRAIGQTAVVTKKIENDLAVGEAEVFGQLWSARSRDGESIQPGEKVTVLSIEGVKLIVERKQEQN